MKKFEQLKQYAIEELGLSREQIRQFGALNRRATWEQAIRDFQSKNQNQGSSNSQLQLTLNNPASKLSDSNLSSPSPSSPSPSSSSPSSSSPSSSSPSSSSSEKQLVTSVPSAAARKVSGSQSTVKLTDKADKTSTSTQTVEKDFNPAERSKGRPPGQSRPQRKVQSKAAEKSVRPAQKSADSGKTVANSDAISANPTSDQLINCPECSIRAFTHQTRPTVKSVARCDCELCQGKGQVNSKTALEWTTNQMIQFGCSRKAIEQLQTFSLSSKLTYLNACVDIYQTRNLLKHKSASDVAV